MPARRPSIGTDRTHDGRIGTLSERDGERMQVQLPVDIGPRRVAEPLGLPQRSQRIDDLAAGSFGQHTAERHRDERDAASGSHRCRGQLRRLAHHQVGSDPIDDRRQVLAHHRGGRPSEHRGEQRPAAFLRRQLHEPVQPSSDRVARRSRQAGGGPLEPHRLDGTAAIGGDRPPHIMATIPQCPSDRRQGVHVPGAARTRTQHPQRTLHRTYVYPRRPRGAASVPSWWPPRPSHKALLLAARH